ncbi:MAG: type IX secretion system plug protein domain-containing protein [Saprospiraceae bacterium]|jgi:hypothetical protein
MPKPLNISGICLLLLLCGSATGAIAQKRSTQRPERVDPRKIRYEDFVYVPNIRSVQFYVQGLTLSYPMAEMGGEARFILEFDDLDGDVKDYFYRIIHCDLSWQPSQVSEMEYLDGFSEDRINDYQFSFKTVKPYTHYTLALPNSSMSWKLSGNYILAVYTAGMPEQPVLTRRFVVVQPRVKVQAQFVRPNMVSKSRTHQEIDFIVNHEKMPLRNPPQEIRAVILQNGRWDAAIAAVPPLFIRSNQLVFDYQDKVVFPAGREFRQIDLRSFRFRSPTIAAIETLRDRIEVTAATDRSRALQPYIEVNDINGKYVPETQDQNNPLAANYADVLFSLQSDTAFYEHEVYLLGAFNDWKPQSAYKMVFNPGINSYVVKVPLKQGFYNYAYALVPINGNVPDFSPIEGDWFETENDYTILIYYRPFGGRYDEIIGMLQFNSR